MATGTLTIKSPPGDPLITAGVKEVYYTLTMGTTYTTNGMTADVSDYITNEVYGMEVVARSSNAFGYLLGYVRATSGAPATGKIRAYYIGSVLTNVPEPFSQVSSSRNLSTVQAIVKFVGR